MITSDAHAGLKAALRTEFGGVPWQRCQFHLQQNAQAHISKVALKKPVAQDIRNIFNAPDLEEAKRLLAQAINKYKVDSHELADWMQDNIEQSFTCFAMPEAHRKRLRTSNMAEVINRELKRRTRIIGIFPNEESLLRISSALLKEVDERWIEGRTYLNMEQ
jgi:transposase-like protein